MTGTAAKGAGTNLKAWRQVRDGKITSFRLMVDPGPHRSPGSP